MDKSSDEIEKLFTSNGGCFLHPVTRIKGNLEGVNTLLFDWDGVFTDGRKDSNRNSSYSELDTMGINLLRFAFWLQQGTIPFTAIITGEENPGAMFVARRDHYDAVYYHVKNKSMMAERLHTDFGVEVAKSLFLFDDVLDLGLVGLTSLSFALRNPASLLFQHYIKSVEKCAYISGNTGGNHGIREIAELIMGLMGQFIAVIEHRAAFSPTYKEFLDLRNRHEPVSFSLENPKVSS